MAALATNIESQRIRTESLGSRFISAQSKDCNWHVLYTRYLEMITDGRINGATAQERADATQWDEIQGALMAETIWK